LTGRQTGEEVVESTKKGGPIELPNGLSRFGYWPLKDFGSVAIAIWGGSLQGGVTAGRGWIMVAE
jgi:hypothetical protein